MDLPSTLDLACGSWTQQPLTQDPLKPDSEESIRWHNEAFSLSGCFLAAYTTVPPGSKLWPLLENHLPGRQAARRPESPGNHIRCQLGHDCQFSMCLTQQCWEACGRPGPRQAKGQSTDPQTVSPRFCGSRHLGRCLTATEGPSEQLFNIYILGPGTQHPFNMPAELDGWGELGTSPSSY